MTAFQRLVSNITNVYLGEDRANAAFNAANGLGGQANLIIPYPGWPSVEKYMNDTVIDGSPSPFAEVANPDYIWVGSPEPGQSSFMAIASNFFIPTQSINFSISLAAFADNAMEAKIELFQLTANDVFEVAESQPDGLANFTLIAGTPTDPTTGLTETQPFSWQDVRVYSTEFFVNDSTSQFKIVISFDVLNYLTPAGATSNPAALQFISDIYTNV